jgi:hypothetical protein
MIVGVESMNVYFKRSEFILAPSANESLHVVLEVGTLAFGKTVGN